MTARHRALGEEGERLAAELLESKGYRVLQRNFRTREGEIDLVARAPDGALVFVEVRTRQGAAWRYAAAESVGPRKQKRLAELAAQYLAEGDADEPARIDVVAVALASDGALVGLEHIENAVEG